MRKRNELEIGFLYHHTLDSVARHARAFLIASSSQSSPYSVPLSVRVRAILMFRVYLGP